MIRPRWRRAARRQTHRRLSGLRPVTAGRDQAGERGTEQPLEAAAEQDGEQRRGEADESDVVARNAVVQAAGEADCGERQRNLDDAPTARNARFAVTPSRPARRGSRSRCTTPATEA